MSKSANIFLLTLSLLALSLPLQAGWTEVHANTVGITVKCDSASFKELLTAVFAELKERYKTDEKFTVDDTIGAATITTDFATDSRMELFAKLQEIGHCRMETSSDGSVISFLPEKVRDPFKTDIAMPR